MRRKKKTGSETERRDTRDTGRHEPGARRRPANRRDKPGARAGNPSGAQRGLATRPPGPPPREAPAAGGGPAESEGAPDVGRNREALPQTTDPPYGPHRPPDHGDGRATPPGSLNLRAGTRELGTRTGAGRTREAQKAGRGARAHPRHRHPPTPARGRATPAPSVPESRGGGRSGRCLEESERVPATAREEIAYHPRCTRDHGAGRERGRTPSGRRRQRRRRAHGGVEGKREKTEEVPRRTRPDTLSPAHLSRNARATTPTRGPGDAPPGEKEGHSHRPERGRGTTTPSAFSVNDPSAGSPTETLLRLLLPLDSQVRPSSQRSARAVGRPRRGRSEGLTKPSNR